MENMVVGFMFTTDLQRVALIHKKRPAWQKGLWNGVGGKIEPGESPTGAMQREFYEEAGLDIFDWMQTVTLLGGIYTVHFFMTYSDKYPSSRTDEEVRMHYVHRLNEVGVIPNLVWLIPLQLDRTVRWPLLVYDLTEKGHE